MYLTSRRISLIWLMSDTRRIPRSPNNPPPNPKRSIWSESASSPSQFPLSSLHCKDDAEPIEDLLKHDVNTNT